MKAGVGRQWELAAVSRGCFRGIRVRGVASGAERELEIVDRVDAFPLNELAEARVGCQSSVEAGARRGFLCGILDQQRQAPFRVEIADDERTIELAFAAAAARRLDG